MGCVALRGVYNGGTPAKIECAGVKRRDEVGKPRKLDSYPNGFWTILEDVTNEETGKSFEFPAGFGDYHAVSLRTTYQAFLKLIRDDFERNPGDMDKEIWASRANQAIVRIKNGRVWVEDRRRDRIQLELNALLEQRGMKSRMDREIEESMKRFDAMLPQPRKSPPAAASASPMRSQSQYPPEVASATRTSSPQSLQGRPEAVSATPSANPQLQESPSWASEADKPMENLYGEGGVMEAPDNSAAAPVRGHTKPVSHDHAKAIAQVERTLDEKISSMDPRTQALANKFLGRK